MFVLSMPDSYNPNIRIASIKAATKSITKTVKIRKAVLNNSFLNRPRSSPITRKILCVIAIEYDMNSSHANGKTSNPNRSNIPGKFSDMPDAAITTPVVWSIMIPIIGPKTGMNIIAAIKKLLAKIGSVAISGRLLSNPSRISSLSLVLNGEKEPIAITMMTRSKFATNNHFHCCQPRFWILDLIPVDWTSIYCKDGYN